jgi:transcriptional regulator with XRE-family HTH domain
MTVAKRVRDCRYATGWGPDELASRAAISRTALYQIECGKTETPRAGTLRRIAEALGVPIESLLGTEEDRSVALPAPESGTWSREDALRRTDRVRNGRTLIAPDPELQHKFQEILVSPLGEGLARIVEETHRLLHTSAVVHP